MKFIIHLIFVTFLAGLTSFQTGTVTSDKKIRVVIDAGHGGEDNGAVYNEIIEKEITEAISRKVKFLNFDKSIEVIVLREKDEFLSLSDRVTKINELNPDLVISLHLNSNKDTTINGFETYVGEKNNFNDQSMKVAESLLKSAPKSLQKQEVKKANLYMLNNVTCPAVLIEMGYVTNSHDREFLSSQLGQQRIAETIVKTVKAK